MRVARWLTWGSPSEALAAVGTRAEYPPLHDSVWSEMPETSHVFILGAGFSIAISDRMPDTNMLGQDAVVLADATADHRVPKAPFGPDFSFETWLSLIAEDQPHLSETENLEQRVLFSKMKLAIYDVLKSRQALALYQPLPEWLGSFLTVAHFKRSTVATLNYDSLVELGVETLRLRSPLEGSRVRTFDVLLGQPPLSATEAPLESGGSPTFRLLKLHGSLDWWSVPGDVSGMSLARMHTESAFGVGFSEDEEYRREILPGREPFIVPPSTVKARHYAYPLLREMWQRLFVDLRGADRISLIGYSLPAADVGMLGLIELATRRTQPQVDVVNRDPDPVARRLRGLGLKNLRLYSGDGAVRDFVSDLVDERSVELCKGISVIERQPLLEWPLIVMSHVPEERDSGSPVVDVRIEGSDVVVVPAGRNRPIVQATSVPHDESGSPLAYQYAKYADLVDAAKSTSGRLLVERDGAREVVVNIGTMERPIGVSRNWIALEVVPS